MGKVGVIAYRRSQIFVHVVDWEAFFKSIDGRDLSVAENVQTIGQVGALLVQRNDDDREVILEDMLEGAERKKTENASGVHLIESALGYLLEQEDIERICITGFGPFENFRIDDPHKNPEKVSTSEDADSPFKSLSLGQVVQDYIDAHPIKQKPKFDIITDVQACAITGYWMSVTDNTIYDPKRPPHAVAAFIVSGGVGGTLVQNDGFTFLSNHHSEAGHISINRHPSDFLDTPECKYHDFCLAGHVARWSIERRAKFLGISMDKLKQNQDHGIWTIITDYLAQMCATSIFMYTPTQIYLGGATLDDAEFLVPRVNELCIKKMRNYASYVDLDRLANPENYFIQRYKRDEWMMIGGLLFAIHRQQEFSRPVQPLRRSYS